jgi:hypothetical protein
MNLDKAKLFAEIAKLGAEIYGIIKEKKREDRDPAKDDHIRKLEARIEELERKVAR